ncbi:carbohydrate kinase family protein [Candidatus Latescibacterota bacterium]
MVNFSKREFMGNKSGIGFIGSIAIDVVYEALELGNVVYSDGSKYLTGDDYESETVEYSAGGMAMNNSINLSKMGTDYPIRIIGKIGADENGARIRDTLIKCGISDKYLIETSEHPTATTHVYYIRDNQGYGNRTFRYYFGAMGDFSIDDIDFVFVKDLKIIMAGYCLQLPNFDTVDQEYGASIGELLERIKEMGILTCIDFITPKREKWWKFKRFQKNLSLVDILSIGEDQAEGITGVSDEKTAVKSLVEDYGVATAVIHCGDKGRNYLYNASTGLIIQPIFKVPPEEFAGNVGAGDAFTSGLLHGIHEEWDMEKSLKFATASAAISLGSITTTGAMREKEYILDYMNSRPLETS